MVLFPVRFDRGADGRPDAGEIARGARARRMPATGGAVRRRERIDGRRFRMDDGGQAEAVPVRGRERRRLRRADRAGRRHGVHGRPDGGRAPGQPVRGRRGAGRVRAAARLQDVPAVLRRRARRVPRRVRPGPRSAASLYTYTPAHLAACVVHA